MQTHFPRVGHNSGGSFLNGTAAGRDRAILSALPSAVIYQAKDQENVLINILTSLARCSYAPAYPGSSQDTAKQCVYHTTLVLRRKLSEDQ